MCEYYQADIIAMVPYKNVENKNVECPKCRNKNVEKKCRSTKIEEKMSKVKM